MPESFGLPTDASVAKHGPRLPHELARLSLSHPVLISKVLDEERRGRLRLVVSPGGEGGSLTIDQDARLFVGLLGPEDRVEHSLGADRLAWIHVARGKVSLNNQELGPGDGAAIRDERQLNLGGIEDSEVVLWEVPEDRTAPTG